MDDDYREDDNAIDGGSLGGASDEEKGGNVDELKARVAMMEKEAKRLREMTAAAEKHQIAVSGTTEEDAAAIDSRSVYVGNVDYGATPEEIQAHFASCGTINRVTILFDKFTGPKGYAYVEFAEPSLVANAMLLSESTFRGRSLKVTPKRTNVPGMGARGRSRGRGRGASRAGHPRGFSPYATGRGRGNLQRPLAHTGVRLSSVKYGST